MTESEWLASADPAAMLGYLRTGGPQRNSGRTIAGLRVYFFSRHPAATDRKLRLWACACCRQVWPLLTDSVPRPNCGDRVLVGRNVNVSGHAVCPTGGSTGRVNRSRRAVETAERYADGAATDEERQSACRGAGEARAEIPGDPSWKYRMIAFGACQDDETLPLRCREITQGLGGIPPAVQAHLLRCVVGNPWRPVPYHWWHGLWPTEDNDLEAEGVVRPVAWVSWNDGTIPKLARAIYEERRFGGPCAACGGRGCTSLDPWKDECPACRGTGRLSNDLPVLADALEEAGCADEEMLHHLRGEVRCPDCLGEGVEILHPPLDNGNHPHPCQNCRGKGWLPAGPACGRCDGQGRAIAEDGKESPYNCADCHGEGRLPWFSARGDWVVDLCLGKG